MGKKKTKTTTAIVEKKESPEALSGSEEDEAVADITSMPWDPTTSSRTVFVLQCVVGYSVALLLAFVLVLLVIVTTPSTESASSYSSDQHIISTLTRIGNSISSRPIASLNVALLYVVFPFVVSVGLTKAPLSTFLIRCLAGYALMVAVTFATAMYVVATDESNFQQVIRRLWTTTTNYYMTAYLILCYATLPLFAAVSMGDSGVVLCRDILCGKRSKPE